MIIAFGYGEDHTGSVVLGVPAVCFPPGFTLDPAIGQISGTPTAAGTFNFQVRVASSGGSSDQKGMQITIK